MENEDRPIDGSIFPVSCSKCSKMIYLQEKYISLYFSLETPISDGSIEVLESHILTQLCFGCAGVILTEAAVRQKMMAPTSLLDDLWEIKRNN
ncbi:hypothetical protein ACFLU8_03990 [Chloroflexota bacterium]